MVTPEPGRFLIISRHYNPSILFIRLLISYTWAKEMQRRVASLTIATAVAPS